MPIDFPDEPTIGQQFSASGQTWVWTGTVWSAYRGGPVVQTGATAPGTVAEGLIWFNTTNGRTYIYYDGAWIDTATSVAISTTVIDDSAGDAFTVVQEGSGRALVVEGPADFTNATVTGLSLGARGGGSDEAFFENDATITTSYEITNGKNAMTAGPITISPEATVTVPSGSVWTVV
jgi:hypothetical protein